MKKNGFKEMVKALLASGVCFYTLENVTRESNDEVLGKCLMHEIYICKEKMVEDEEKNGYKRVNTALCMRYRQEEDNCTWLETVYDTYVYWDDIFEELRPEVDGHSAKLTYQCGY